MDEFVKRCEEHSKKIDQLFLFNEKARENLSDIEKRQIRIEGDVSYIKTSIDSTTHSINKILEATQESAKDRQDIRGTLKDHGFWVGVLKNAVTVVTGVLIVAGASAVFFLAQLLKK